MIALPSPAQVANDLAAQANFWAKRDRDVSVLCNDAARLIRAFLAGEKVDGRTLHGVYARLLNRESGAGRGAWGGAQLQTSLLRGRLTLDKVSREPHAMDQGTVWEQAHRDYK